jgi:hypothetical protein
MMRLEFRLKMKKIKVLGLMVLLVCVTGCHPSGSVVQSQIESHVQEFFSGNGNFNNTRIVGGRDYSTLSMDNFRVSREGPGEPKNARKTYLIEEVFDLHFDGPIPGVDVFSGCVGVSRGLSLCRATVEFLDDPQSGWTPVGLTEDNAFKPLGSGS